MSGDDAMAALVVRLLLNAIGALELYAVYIGEQLGLKRSGGVAGLGVVRAN